jgi:hypothetical protein
MSFQWIFDNAVSINMNRRPIVSQTTSRDQRIRTVSRGGNIWRFTVTMPSGMRWQDNRANIEAVDYANMLNVEYVNLAKPAYNYIVGYRGDATDPTQMTFHFTSSQAYSTPDKFLLGNLPTMNANAMLFRAGDFIQPIANGGATLGHVYTIVNDVPRGTQNAILVTVHRTILETPGQGYLPLNVGGGLGNAADAVQWKVVCTQCPTWTITPGGLVQWSGPFVFAESLL